MVDWSYYKQQLEKQLNPQAFQSAREPTGSYSALYQQFKAEQTGTAQTFYEKACALSGRILKFQVNDKKRKELQPFIEISHIAVTPESVYAFTYLIALFIVIIGSIISIFLGSLILIVISLGFAVLAFFLLPRIPKSIFNKWRATASDQLVTAILYMVIYMDHTSNLEQAVAFTAKHLPPPLSLDFMKVLWDTEVSKFSTVSESLDNYSKLWKGKNNEFIESLQLLKTSLVTREEDKRKDILERAVDTILQGTEDHMLEYAHNLQSPIESLHMLGVVLPVMGLVMLPLVGAFMGESIKWYNIVILYNIVIPIAVYFLGKQVLSTRPSGSTTIDIYTFKKIRKAKSAVDLGKYELAIPPIYLSLFVIIIILIYPVFYFYGLYSSLSGTELTVALNSITSLIMSILIIVAIGFSVGLYYYTSVGGIIKKRRETEELENEFASAVFQLGNRIEEGIPTEMAFAKIVDATKGTEISKFFKIIDYNLKQQGMSMKDAIFNEKTGAIHYYPSAIIKSVMNVLIEGAKKGPQIASHSLITISKFLLQVHRVNERLKDMLSDTLASMKMQAKIFIPVIGGIVVGLAALTTGILISLGEQLKQVSIGEAGDLGVGTSLLGIFQIEHMLPAFMFQVVVGLYLVQISYVLSIMISGIIHGSDEIERNYIIGQNLFIGTTMYVVIAIITTLAFKTLTAGLSNIV